MRVIDTPLLVRANCPLSTPLMTTSRYAELVPCLTTMVSSTPVPTTRKMLPLSPRMTSASRAWPVAEVSPASLRATRARAAEDRVASLGELGGGVEAEQAGAAADQVVLAEVAEDQAAAAVAFD